MHLRLVLIMASQADRYSTHPCCQIGGEGIDDGARLFRRLRRRWVMVCPRCSGDAEWVALKDGVRARLKLASTAVFGGRVTSGYAENGD